MQWVKVKYSVQIDGREEPNEWDHRKSGCTGCIDSLKCIAIALSFSRSPITDRKLFDCRSVRSSALLFLEKIRFSVKTSKPWRRSLLPSFDSEYVFCL